MENTVVDAEFVGIDCFLGNVNVNGVTGQALSNDGPFTVLTDKWKTRLWRANIVHVVTARGLARAAIKL